MSVLLWGVLALGGGLLVLWVGARLARPRAPSLPPDVELPPTPLQRAARWTVGLGAALAAGAAALVVVSGAETLYEDDALRLTFTGILVAMLAVVGVATIWMKGQVTRDDGVLDERDKEILGRAPAFQAVAMIVTLAVWVIGLAEHYHDAGAVPVFYLYLIFWSVLVVNLLGLPVGILVGYRRH